jgi:hypothetical protein
LRRCSETASIGLCVRQIYATWLSFSIVGIGGVSEPPCPPKIPVTTQSLCCHTITRTLHCLSYLGTGRHRICCIQHWSLGMEELVSFNNR